MAAARSIFIIRHGEKPPDGQNGADVFGNGDPHSLVPRGWHRAAALETLFAPSKGPFPSGLITPTELIAPDYGNPTKNIEHRTSQTILPLARLIGLSILTYINDKNGNPVHCTEGNEAAIGAAVADEMTPATLICWEHTAIFDIASNIKPVSNGDQIPKNWDKERFDVIYTFTRNSASEPYTFNQILQELFPDDPTQPMTDTVAAVVP